MICFRPRRTTIDAQKVLMVNSNSANTFSAQLQMMSSSNKNETIYFSGTYISFWFPIDPILALFQTH